MNLLLRGLEGSEGHIKEQNVVAPEDLDGESLVMVSTLEN